MAENSIRQAMQEIILCSLHHSGFFDMASFHGGTALRIFHEIDRFSEDLDFTLMTASPGFDLQYHLDAILDGLQSFGMPGTAKLRGMRSMTSVLTATVSTNLRNAMVLGGFDESILGMIHRDMKISVKIDVDTDPPENSRSEIITKTSPLEYAARVDCLSTLFAGKLAAILCRRWENRVKGRDYFDFEWYVRNGVPLDLLCLESRLSDKNCVDVQLTEDLLLELLDKKLDTIDYDSAREDIRQFAYDTDGFENWNADHFKSISRRIVFL